MGAVDTPEPSGKGKKGGLRRPKRRVKIRIDMTPMVDVAFLLLIFFMVTTVFRKPQAMEVNLPPKDTKVQVPESNVLTMFVRADERIYYKMGTGDLQPVEFNGLINLWETTAKLNPELIILVKVSRQASYNTMVDIMDDLDLADIPKRFSLVAMKEEDIKVVEGLP
jgi:biopolymer transport protein ExbD